MFISILFLLTFILHFGFYQMFSLEKKYLTGFYRKSFLEQLYPFEISTQAIVSYNILFIPMIFLLTYKTFQVVKYVLSHSLFFWAIFIYNSNVSGKMVLDIGPFLLFSTLKLGVELVYDGIWYGVKNFKPFESEFFKMSLWGLRTELDCSTKGLYAEW